MSDLDNAAHLSAEERDTLAIVSDLTAPLLPEIHYAYEARTGEEMRRSDVLRQLEYLEEDHLVRCDAGEWIPTVVGSELLEEQAEWLARGSTEIAVVDADHRLAEAKPAAQPGGDD